MKLLWCICFLCISLTYSLSASLTVTQYEPLTFRLDFSSPIPTPQFQIFLNSINNLPSKVISTKSPSNSFVISANSSQYIGNSKMQLYTLMFSTPLAVGDGDLQLKYYSLKAHKSSIYISYPQSTAVILIIFAYTASLFTLLGRLMIEFIQIFILFSFGSGNSSQIYQTLYEGMLVIPPESILVKMNMSSSIQSYINLCMSLPLMFIVVTGVIGLVFKKLVVGERSIMTNIFYELFTYSLFMKTIDIFNFNLIYNSVQFMIISKSKTLSLSSATVGVSSYLCYLNFAVLIFTIYLKIYILNPKIGQSQESWQKYLKSKQFMDFRVLHEGLEINSPIKRNYSLNIFIKSVLKLILFFSTSLFQYFIFLIEFINLYMIFTIRPYRQEFYRNSKVICRLLMIILYLIFVLGNLYFGLGDETNEYYTIKSFMIALSTLFLLFQMAFLGFVFAEIYFKCSNLNYAFKVVRQANEFKLEIIQKNRTERESTINRKTQPTYYSNKSLTQNRKGSPSDSKSAKILKQKTDDPLLDKEALDISPNRPKRAKSKTKISIEMKDLSESGRARNISIQSPRSSSRSPQVRKKNETIKKILFKQKQQFKMG